MKSELWDATPRVTPGEVLKELTPRVYYIGITQMNSIFKVASACDDSKAILERMISNGGIEVVQDNDPRAVDIAVNFMYPTGARKAIEAAKVKT